MNLFHSIAWTAGLFAALTGSGVSAQDRRAGAAQGADAAAAIIELEEVVVTGSRLRRLEEPPSVSIFDRTAIAELGVQTVADVLNYLPQQPYRDSDVHRPGGARFIELRGIGADASIVLINGRRAVPSGGASVSFNAFDLNTLPLAAVERIEVLSEAASAVYGADAIGGVINIQLKDDAYSPTLDVYYGGAKGGAEERRVSAAGGFAGSRARVSLLLDAFDRNELSGEERSLRADQDYRRFGSIDRRSLNGNPGNISSTSAANLPGLPSRVAAVPLGSTGVGLAPADFLATAGQQRRESLGRFVSIVPEARRLGAAVFAEIDVLSDTTLFSELLYTDNELIALTSPPSTAGLVTPSSNPFNPFGVDVAVNYLLTGIGPRRSVAESDSLRAVAGARGRLGAWEWETAVIRSDEDGAEWIENAADPDRVAAALASSDPATALNVFQDGPGASPNVLASLIASPDKGAFGFEATQASAFMRGDVASWAAGDVQLVVGGEWRQEDMAFRAFGVDIAPERTVKAAFTELELPLLGGDRTAPAVNSLSLTLAGRFDQYDDFGDTFNPQYALNYKPTSHLLLRAAYSTSFRAPSLYELYSPRRAVPGVIVTDPVRNETYAVVRVTGGDPSLQPIDAHSSTFGAVWAPAAISGLRLAASYWRIRMDGRVSLLQPQQILNFESLFPNNVVRAAPEVSGAPGRVQQVATSYVNFGRLDTDGVDLNARYSIKTRLGVFAPSLAASWIDTFEVASLPGVPIIDRVGVAQAITGSITEWRATAALAWSLGGWGASVTARYVPSYADATTGGVLNGRTIDAQTLVDAQTSFQFEDASGFGRVLSGMRISAGATNVFDQLPRFAEAGGPFGHDPYQSDPRGRFVYVKLSKQF